MELFLFILVNAAMFLRPGEIAPELAAIPIYLILTLGCFLISVPKLFVQGIREPMTERPVTLCMFGLLAANYLSHMTQGNMARANGATTDFFKVLMYYLMLVGVVDSPARLKRFLISLLLLVTLMTSLALLQYHGAINIPALKVLERTDNDPDAVTGEDVVVYQLVGTGIFNDPNDLCVVLTMGIVIGLYFFNDLKPSILRWLYLIPTMILGYGLYRTQSRGGLLACAAAILTLMAMRIGAKKTIALGLLGLPVVLVVMGGRFSKMSTGENTAQQRLDLWREALIIFRRSPLFGNGVNTIDSEMGLVAHNSYVHAFSEMGLFGGTLFVGVYYFAFVILMRLGRRGSEAVIPEMRSMRPYMVAIVVGFAVSLYSISRDYSVPAYIAVGLAEAYQRVAADGSPGSRLRLNPKLILGMLTASVGFLIFITLFLRIV